MSKLPPDADVINEYFAKICSVLAAEIKPIDNKIRNNRVKDTMVGYNSHKFPRYCENSEALKNQKSSGRDGISKEILKCCSPVLEQILAEIFNEMTEFSL